MKKITLLLSILILAISTTNVAAQQNEGRKPLFAQDNGNLKEAKAEFKEEKSEAREDFKESVKEVICKRLEGRIDQRMKVYETRRDSLISRFTTRKDRLNRLIIDLKAKGVDTSELEASLVVLQSKIDVLKVDVETLLTAIEETKTYECGESSGEFKSAVERVKSARSKVQSTVTDIKAYLKNTVKPEIVALRETSANDSQKSSTGASGTDTPAESDSKE